ncbi:hypothetical protein C8R44DRAFT_835401 [Mycena epipterygia]|nr:hypothetical protein C8R44DRAFT_835401 [Mycena epipterygia]
MGRISLWTQLKYQLFAKPPVLKADLRGQTVCVLGANTGIGFQACKHFATMNPARIILACRSETRGQAAVNTTELRAETGYTNGELWLIDLADFESIKRFGDRFKKDGGRLDILVANAAVESRNYTKVNDGWELIIQVNHLSTALTCLLLLPSMMWTAQQHATLPRIVVVASERHYMVTIDEKTRTQPGKILETLSSEKFLTPSLVSNLTYTPTRTVFNVFFAREFAARLGATAPVIVDITNPGFTVSELRRDIDSTALKLFEKAFAITAEEASRSLIWAALARPDDTDSLRGAYTNVFNQAEPSDFVVSKEGAQVQPDFWKTITILGRVDPRVLVTAQKYLSA